MKPPAWKSNCKPMKTVTVKLTGAAAALTGTRQVSLNMEDEGTYQDLIRLLAAKLPVLVSLVIDPDSQEMLSSNFFQLSDAEFIMPGMWEMQPADGAVITLISPVTGG